MFVLNELVERVDHIENALKVFKFDLAMSVVVNLIIIMVLFKLTTVFTEKLKNHYKTNDPSKLSAHLIPILDRIIKFLILFFVIASFLQSNGYSITSLIAGFGITGLAVGFAAQQTIADFFGTLTIITDKMYKIGDYVKIGDVEGTVEDINLLSTKIRTLDDFIVAIPNNSISSAVVTNISKARKRRIVELFTVTYDTSDEKLQQAIDIIKEVCQDNPNVHKDVNVFVETLSSSSIDIKLLAYAKTKSANELFEIRSNVILEIVKRFREANIDFAFPSTSVYIEKK